MIQKISLQCLKLGIQAGITSELGSRLIKPIELLDVKNRESKILL